MPRATQALMDEGKIRYVGISEACPDDIRAAHAVCPLSAVQMEWSLWSRCVVAAQHVHAVKAWQQQPAQGTSSCKPSLASLRLVACATRRDCEADLVPVCRELGIGIVAYSPLGRGFLTGAITKPEDLPADDSRRNYPRYQGEAFAKVRAQRVCCACACASMWFPPTGVARSHRL